MTVCATNEDQSDVELTLYCWDVNHEDNSGSITVTVAVTVE